jgi:hypothetical protein
MGNRKDHNSSADSNTSLAVLSKWLGVAALVAVPAAGGIGFLWEQIGVINLFRAVVMPLSLAAVVTGLISMNRAAENSETAKQKGRLGLILGLVGLGLTAMIMLLVMLFILPMLFLSR